jgi:hypothetical protein
LVSVGLRIDLEDNGVSRLDLFEDLIGMDWLDEDGVMV